jgi:hypothetical protein
MEPRVCVKVTITDDRGKHDATVYEGRLISSGVEHEIVDITPSDSLWVVRQATGRVDIRVVLDVKDGKS